MTHKVVGVLLAAVSSTALVTAAMADVTDKDLAKPAGNEWLHSNGSWDGTRFSTLSQINTSNARDLEVKWIYSIGGETDAQATPSYHDGLLFMPQDNGVHAIDAETGTRVWKYQYELPEDWGGQFIPFFTGKHRGVALYGDKVYFLSNDCNLIALDYRTGEVAFTQDSGRPYPKDFEMAADGNGYFCTSGALAVPGKIIIPMNATDTGGLQGYVDARDPETGEKLWEANMIPGPGEPGAETWPGNSREYGGAGPWIVGSYDPDLNMYYTGTANAYPWNPYTERQGAGTDAAMANVGAAAIVAVDVETGEVPWRYTVVPGDPWDYDAMQTPILVDMDGRRTIVQANKTGFMHYLDAETGEFLQAPAIADKITWAKGYNPDGSPIWGQAIPAEGEMVEFWPSFLGATNMYPAAYNPQSGQMYLARRETGANWLFEKVQVVSNVRNLGVTFEALQGGDQVVSGHNIKDGSEVWRISHPEDGYSGGMLTTAGNLTIFANQAGLVHVTNADTGEILYTFNANSASKAGPMTYVAGGEQYITFPFGGLPSFGSAPDDNPVNHASVMVTFGLK